MPISISNDLFRDFLNCKYKAFLKISGRSGQKSDYENLQAALLQDYRHQAEKHLLHSLRPDATVEHDPASLSEAIGRGPAAITSAKVAADGISCHFDALIRVSASSCRAEYLPILYQYANQISKYEKLLLAFCGLALTRLQGGKVPIGKIICGFEHTTAGVQLAKLLGPAKKTLQRMVDLQDSTTPPISLLNDHCSICEFNEHCHTIAREKDDLSLLRGLKEQEIVRLNSRGIFTVTQYSHTFRLRKRQVKGPNHGRKHDLALQAMAIRTGKTYVTETPQVASSDTQLYLDVEGLPDRGLCYLIGLLQCNGPIHEYHPFWADRPSDEEAIWKSFMAHIGTLKDFTLFHYGVFDLQTLRRMHKRYGGESSELDRLSAASCNVLATIYSRVYFPTYSNGLKNVAGHLGFKWTDEKASGIQSIVWRNRWEATKDENVKHTLLTYNREDCLALQRATEALRVMSSQAASTLQVPRDTNSHYHKQAFFFSELDHVNKCAYFDYQRSRVYARTAPAVGKSLRRKESKEKSIQRVNREVIFGPPQACSQCGQTKLLKGYCRTKVVYDLRLTKSGIMRSVIRYKSWTFRCCRCNCTFISPEYQSAAASKYGLTLKGWAVNHIIALRNPWTVISEHLCDLFGYSLARGTIGYFKRTMAAYYEKTFAAIGEKLRHGSLVHADETQAKVKNATGYVWVFTNLEEVLYVYSDTREGDTMREILKGFHGVLVSDFYAAYDSVSCAQQKCLIHLIRDLNDDLFKNPFDEEFKQLAQGFTSVIAPIVETIDRFGLKKIYLEKHKPIAQMFLDAVAGHDYRSEAVAAIRHDLPSAKASYSAFLTTTVFRGTTTMQNMPSSGLFISTRQ